MSRHDNDASTNDGDVFDSLYFIWIKRSLSIHGQWPYKPFRERAFRVTVSGLFVITLVIPQLKKCLDELRYNWENTSDPLEKKILERHGEKGRLATIYYLVIIYSLIGAWAMTPWLPKIMDFIRPLNGTRPNIAIFQTDYGIDPDVYFYPLLIHGTLGCCVGTMMLMGIDTLYMSMAQHACAMFAIVRYRLENIIQEKAKFTDIVFDPDIRDDISYQQVISCVNIHRRIIEFTGLIQTTIEWALIVLLGISMLVLSITGILAVSPGIATQDSVRFTCFAIAQVIHIFCTTLPGHWIMSASVSFRNSCYNIRWYMMSRRSRGLVIMMLRRTLTPCTIVAGRIYVMSMKNFSSILQTSMSYFTLLTSIQ